MKKLHLSIVSLFGIGFIRPISATWGSLATGIGLYFIWPTVQLDTKIIIITSTFLLGWYTSNKILKNANGKFQNLHDPYYIVIDETVGMMITTIFLGLSYTHWILAFILFRIFDIAKIWPASYFDKQAGGFSIMFDDILMAVPSLIILQAIITYGIG
jgi:phosphatidylglycerophosphatase A